VAGSEFQLQHNTPIDAYHTDSAICTVYTYGHE